MPAVLHVITCVPVARPDAEELVEQETGYARARDRSLARLREGMDLGTGGHIDWSRDSVHER